MKRILIVLAVLVGLLLAAASTQRGMTPADLTIIVGQDHLSLDPQKMSYMHDLRLAYAIYEGLTRLDLDDSMKPVPALAERWEISPDGLAYTFHLRQAVWSNGEPVTARDAAYAWFRLCTPEGASDFSGSIAFKVRGAREHFDHRVAALAAYAQRPEAERTPEAARALHAELDAHFARTVGVRAPDDRTLVLELHTPVTYFLDLCAFPAVYPVHRATIEKWSHADARTGLVTLQPGWCKPPHVVCNGPYVVEQWNYKQQMLLRANPRYTGSARPKSRTIRVLPIDDGNTAVLTYLTGGADWHTDVEVQYIPEMLEQQREGKRPEFHPFPAFGTYFWSFNCTPRLTDGRANPFHDARVRRAFALAVDKQAIVDRVKRGGEPVSGVIVPRDAIPGYRSPDGLGYDPERARGELAAAGWTDRNGDGLVENEAGEAFPIVEMLCTPAGQHADIAQAMGPMFERTLGVKTAVIIKETKVYADALDRRDYVMARGGWFGDYSDPTTFLDFSRTGDGNNDRGFSSPEYDDLMKRADRETDPEARLAILTEAERMLVEQEMPVLPLYQYVFYYLYQPEPEAGGSAAGADAKRNERPPVRGLRMNARVIEYLHDIEVLREGAEQERSHGVRP